MIYKLFLKPPLEADIYSFLGVRKYGNNKLHFCPKRNPPPSKDDIDNVECSKFSEIYRDLQHAANDAGGQFW